MCSKHLCNCVHKTDYGWAVVLPILYFGPVIPTVILDIPVLHLCFGLVSYFAFAFICILKKYKNLNLMLMAGSQYHAIKNKYHNHSIN